MDNMRFYEQGRSVPDEAKKTIGAGRLKGFTDVNPMWRIKKLTEMFGPCGIGWWYKITDKRIVEDLVTNQKAAFMDILLFYRDPATGEVSEGIPGTGGSAFLVQENKGPYLSDECFKMALTDAIGVAAKPLGIAADVYWDKDRTKYTTPDNKPSGSVEAAQDAGRKKLEEIKAKQAEAAQKAPVGPQKGIATPEQIEYIKKHADDEIYVKAMEAFGPDLEKMTAAQAAKLIARIQEGGVQA